MNLNDLEKRKGIVHIEAPVSRTQAGQQLMMAIQRNMLIYETRYLAHLDVIEYIGRSDQFDEIDYVAGVPLPLYIPHFKRWSLTGLVFNRVYDPYKPKPLTNIGYSNKLQEHVVVSYN